MAKQPEPMEFATFQEVAAFFDVSLTTIQNWRRKGMPVIGGPGGGYLVTPIIAWETREHIKRNVRDYLKTYACPIRGCIEQLLEDHDNAWLGHITREATK